MRGPHGLEADVWSVGCMLYTLLVGRPPFDTHGVKNTLTKVIQAEYHLPDKLSPEARHLISALLQKNPRDRLPLDRKYLFLKVDVGVWSEFFKSMTEFSNLY